MPPPLKLIVTSEHEEVLWERKLLNTDTSLGMIQAVIFYLIKCFGLWQGKDLKSLKTEHVSFGEDNLGKFVTIDIKIALGSGKMIKRYDDPDNPRSVYKILKTYKGYLANEGPFLVRPISSIKDYICYSPWPLGVNIIEQTVVNLMQECGVGSGFGNISVCLMAIDILKSFGAGSHCISTWLFRLYPRYKKTFWADMFKKCCAINCEDKSQEACLMISHILDPPYPAATMLFEMRKKQEIIKNKIETVNAQRTHVFNSWLQNINSKQNKELAHDFNQGNDLLDANAHIKTKITLKALTAAKGHSIKTKSRNIKEALKRKLSQSERSSDSSCQPGCPSSPPEASQITVKTELMSDLELYDNKPDGSDVKIMTVLSIPESAYSAQIDEAECSTNKNKILRISTSEESRTAASKSEHCVPQSRSLAVKRKLKCSEVSALRAAPKVKQSTPCIKSEELESSIPCEDQVSLQPEAKHVSENADQLTSLNSKVKLEPESDCEDSIEATCDDSYVLDHKIKEIDNGPTAGVTSIEQCQSDCFQNENDSYNLPSKDGSTNWEAFSHIPQDRSNHLQQSYTSHLACNNSSLDILTNQNERSHLSHPLKEKHMTTKAVLLPLSSSSSSVMSSPSDETKNNSAIQQKQINYESESSKELPASNDCDGCERTTLNDVNESSSGKITQKRSVVRSSRSQNKLKSKTICLRCTCSHGKKIINVDSSDVDGSSGVRFADVDSGSFSASSHEKSSEPSETHVRPDNSKSLDHCSCDGHLATDLVQFLDAAHKQLQNILKTSNTDSNSDCASKDSRSNRSLLHSKVSRIKRRLGMVKVIKSDKNVKEENSCDDLESGLTRSSRCYQSSAFTSKKRTRFQKSATLTKDRSCPLLRSVLEGKRTQLAETRRFSIASRNLAMTSKANRSKKRFVSVRLKTPRTLQSHFELDIAEKRLMGNHSNKMLTRSFQNLPRSGKDLTVVKQSLDHGATITGGCLPDQHRSSEIDQPHSGIHCNHSHTNSSPETSLLKEANVDSHAQSGIFHYKSDYHENAIYQMLQIKQESQGTTTFTISDLPMHVNDQKEHLNSQRSEICLGDYFPAGTVIPARGIKLLTRQGAAGLELVLKFDFNLHENINSTVNKDNKNEMKGSAEQDGSHSEFVKDKETLNQVCSGHHLSAD